MTGTRTADFSAIVNPHSLSTTAHFDYGLDSSLTGGATAAAVTYDQSTPEQPVGSDSADHTVTAAVSGLLPDATYHVRVVATNVDGSIPGADKTFKTAADKPPPPPVLGKEVNVSPVSGVVFVKAPPGATLAVFDEPPVLAFAAIVKGTGFVPLTEARQLPVGTQVDARLGTLSLVSASAAKRQTYAGTFKGGLFKVLQSRSRKQLGLTELDLQEGTFRGSPSFAGCTGKSADPRAAASAVPKPGRLLQLLRAEVKGRFRTRGRYAAATVRGTEWDTSDRCDGTLVAVRRGTVLVTDFRRRKTITLHAGKQYLAKAR